MATNLRSLSVSVVARTSKFRKGMRRASKSVNRFGANVLKTAAKLTAFGSAAAAAVAGGGLGILVRNQLSLVDAITVTSDKLGIATDKLVGLRLAAELSGQSVKNMELGLQRMTRRVAEAAQGTGEAKKAIKELGLNAKDLVKLSPDLQFAKIGDALEGVALQADKVRLGFKLFDAEGVGLITTLKGGSAALRAVQADAEKLGLTFSRIDGGKVQALNVSISRLRGLIRGAARTLAVELAPLLGAMADKVIEIGLAGGGVTQTIVRGFETALKITAKIATVWDEINLLAKKSLLGLKEPISLLRKLQLGVTSGATVLGIGGAVGGISGASKSGKSGLRAEIDKLELSLAAGTRMAAVEKFFDGIRKAAEDAAKKSLAPQNALAIIRGESGRFFRRIAISGQTIREGLLGGLGGGTGASISAGAPSGSLTQLTSGFGVVSGVAKTNAILAEVARDVKSAIELIRQLARNASSLKFAS